MTSAFAQPTIGSFDNHTDIGPCQIPGQAFYDADDQTYTLSGSGANIWGSQDEFHYLWTTLQGDFILRAEGAFPGAGGDPHRKLGWMVRNSLAPGTPQVLATTHGDGLSALQYRRETGSELAEIQTDSFADVLQLERRGATWILSVARFGEEFRSVELADMPLDEEVYVGLFVCAHDADQLETARFRNVRIVQPVDPDYTPYQDYIGSRLEVLEVATGHRRVLYESEHSIQAPNWTVDGRQLIYNSKGNLYTYDLETNTIDLLNTGFADNNNNDHVLTFDGSLIGLSHHAESEDGRSTLYYMPTTGSDEPVRVTRPGVGHSYLHGWTPDNKKMIFTANRKGRYDIYTVDVATGEETQLTDLETLDDGPEFSPDGKHVFFNSVRTGTMQLWRMDADGGNPTQLTFDKYNDWFPHVSPDQQWIVFISFPADIDPSDHPFYKHCLIRIMPYEGGTPRVIGYVYGGQGTINVPSWSPDGRFVALVTNSRL
jgi:Tol biopolymer transport system component